MPTTTDNHTNPAGRTRGARWSVVVVGLALGAATAAGCSSNSTATPTTSAPSSTTAPLSPVAVKALQTALARVGCYTGPIDGVVGSVTTQAVKAFQSAVGIQVDGVYGATTRAKLTADGAAGTRVCTATGSTTTSAGTGGTTTTAAAASAPCTAATVGAAFPTGETVVSFQCAGGWAAGSKTNGNYDSAFLLHSVNGTWSVAPASDCTNAAALGIPTAILNISSCKVS